MPQAVTVRRIKKVDRLVGGHVVEPSGEHHAHIALAGTGHVWDPYNGNPAQDTQWLAPIFIIASTAYRTA